MDDLVVGDIIHLSAGGMIPADVRILDAKDLFVSQASLSSSIRIQWLYNCIKQML